MKKIYTQLSLLIFICGTVYAQLPNPSFETWTTDVNGNHPISWLTSDQTSMTYASVHSAEQEGIVKCDSLFSIKLTSFTFFVTNYAPGVATNGVITSATSVAGGSPYTLRSAKFAGCYKYNPAGADSGKISAALSKWNGTTRDTVALATLITYASGGLVNFQLDFNYFSIATPDTILVLLASGQGVNQTVSGSSLIVDNLHFIGIIGIDENSIIQDVNIYPQPAQDVLNVHLELNQHISLKYEIADITGRKILSGKLDSEKIDISNLSRGNYVIKLHNEEGAVLHSSQFVVSK